MNASTTVPPERCTREQVREAAVWLALLHGPERTEKLERGFRRWLAARPAHAAAFEKISTAWEATGALPRGPLPQLTRWQRAGFRQGFVHAAAAMMVLAVVGLGVWFYGSGTGVATEVGEQRMLTLEDGTRVFLNTDTRLAVKYDPQRRRVELERGEALFEVARRQPGWPFVVTVDGKEITALGTSFVVRRDARRLSVTLVEGRVAVSGKNTSLAGKPDQPVVLSSGQRWTLADAHTPRLDSPAIDKVTAWRAGHVDLVKVPLAEAVAEMNRYSRVQIEIEQPAAAVITITGIFRVGDTASFANAVADTYGLQVLERPSRIILLGTPSH